MMGDWTFFSNYGHVLVCLARDNEARLRDVALEVGITERAVQKIVRDMQEAGYLTVTKQGRCNRYQINKRRSLRHSLESHCNVGKLLTLLSRSERAAAGAERVKAKLSLQKIPQAASGLPEEISTRYPGETEAVASGPEKKKAAKTDPEDTRQQGSLF